MQKINEPRTVKIFIFTLLLISLAIAQINASDLSIEILSPEPNTQVLQNEVTIAISFMAIQENVDPAKTKLLIDNMDVSKYVEFYDDFLVLSPPKLKPGDHKVKIEFYEKNGTLFGDDSFNFTVVREIISSYDGPSVARKVRGRFFTNYRSQSLQDGEYSYDYFYSGLNISGNNDKLEWKANLLYSNQDKEDRQPVNQYSAAFKYEPLKNIYFSLNAGDVFPRYDELFFMGIRNRGFEIDARLKFLSFKFIKGNISRAINERSLIRVDSLTNDSSTVISQMGVYDREVTGFMPAIHIGSNATTRFYYLHFKDDIKSATATTGPQENAVLGISQNIRADQSRFIVNFQAAASIYNYDISSGDIRFDTLKSVFDWDNSIKKVYDIGKKMITINQYLAPGLPYAMKGDLHLNYFRNLFSFQYRYVQDGFTSFGNPYLLKDISGLSLMDRFQLIPGKTYLTLQYEKLKSQFTDDAKNSLNIQRFGFAVNYYPGKDYPSLSIGFTNHSRNNDQAIDPDSILYSEENSINQLYASSNYKVATGDITHSFSLNFSNYIKSDKIYDNRDNSTQTIGGSIKSDFTKDSYSRIFFTLNSSDIAKGDTLFESTFKSTSFGLQLGHHMRKVFTDDDLNLSVQYYYNKNDYQFYQLQNSLSSLTKQLIGRNSFGFQANYDLKEKGRFHFNYIFAKYGNDVDYKDNFITLGYEKRF